MIGTEFRSWLKERSIDPVVGQIGARTPADTIRACADTPVVADWHRDGLPDPTDREGVPSVRYLILWSNQTPTELRGADGRLIESRPCDVMLIDNHRVWHRSPPAEEGRWFVGLTDPLLPADLAGELNVD